MIVSALLLAGVTFRRLATARSLLLAIFGGLVAGLLAVGVPSPNLARDVLDLSIAAVVALIVLPLVAGLPTSDRKGGFEALQAVRPVHSLGWSAGRLQGSFFAGILLMLIVAHVAYGVAATRDVPSAVEGKPESLQGNSGSVQLWRFSLPSGALGPFVMSVETFVPFAGAGSLDVATQRGAGEHRQTVNVLPVRRHEVLVPDLSPHRGDLYVGLVPRQGAVLGARAPTLAVGREPLAVGRPHLSRGVLGRLALALLVVLVAAQVFHFETACLAGTLALAVSPPDSPGLWVAVAASLLAFAALGTALVRREALP